jgi:transposase
LLPALTLDGIIHLEVVENAITRDNFLQFVRGLLPQMNKWPHPNSVLVIDKAAIHKVPGIRELIEEHGARLLFLPLYSPDFNPIELAFPTIKAWLLKNQDRANEEMETKGGTINDIFGEAVHSVTAEQAKYWFTHCGYEIQGK